MKKYICITVLSVLALVGCGNDTSSHTQGAQTDVQSVIEQNIRAEENVTEVSEVLSEETVEETTQLTAASTSPEVSSGETVDLTELGSDMVYAVVFEMMTEPEKYMGKTIRIKGTNNRYTDIETGQDYYACLIKDAAACCAQGIEYKLPEGAEYPDFNAEITVSGVFGSYFEGENEYFVLENAVIE